MLTKPIDQREYDLNAEAAERYTKALWATEGEHALEYLKSERGFTEESINHFGLGYVADPVPGDEIMQGRIAFPYWNLHGVSTLRFRVTPDMDGPKFMDRPGARSLMYNITAVNEGGDLLYVVEGEPDCIIATQMGFTAVALSGAQKWKDSYRHLLAGYNNIRVICDTDDKGAGLELGETIKLAMDNTYVQILPAPQGHDLNSAFLEQGTEALIEHWEL